MNSFQDSALLAPPFNTPGPMIKLKAAHILIPVIIAFHIPLFSSDLENDDYSDNSLYEQVYLFTERDKFIAENGDLPVSGITIRGLEKTRKSVILNESGITTGERLSSFNPHKFVNMLKRKNLFTDIKIGYIRNSESATIELSLVEKWSIIPLPMLYSNGDTTTYGIFVLESNFLGYNKTVFAGGTISKKGRSIIAGFVDPSICGTRFTSNIFILYKDSIFQNKTMDKIPLSEYSSVNRVAMIDAGYYFFNVINLALSGGYKDGTVDKKYDDSYNAPESQKFYQSGTVAKVDLLKYYDYFYYGFKGEIRYYTHIPDNNENRYNTIEYKIDYSHKIFNFHRVTFYSAGSSGNRPVVLEERIAGKTGTRTLPADFIAADNYANYSIIYEYPFYKFSRGLCTFVCFWEEGTFNEDDSQYCHYYGPGGGVLLYFKKIAFPAVGINFARNLKTGSNEFSVNVGLKF